MFRIVLPTIETLFAGNGRPRQTVHFDWRLIRRKRQPFLLLPTAMTECAGRFGTVFRAAPARKNLAGVAATAVQDAGGFPARSGSL